MIGRLWVVASFVVAGLSPAAAYQLPVVMPDDVARSAATHYPAIDAARADRQAALGERLSAQGAFDTRLQTTARSRLEGFYSGDTFDTEITRPFGPLGTELYGGYRVSRGDFPTYEDKSYTDQGGEVRVGIIFNLLRDRAIDERRAGVRKGDLGVAEAELEILLTETEVQREALVAYWHWVTKGRMLTVYEELLGYAERRDSALKREVASGARAAIDVIENAQNLTRRRELVRRAERDLLMAANDLSLYLRAAQGDPVVPKREQLPGALPLPFVSGEPGDLPDRPDLRLFDIARERLVLERQLARNERQPRLNFGIEGSNDFGAIGPGGISRDPTELTATVTLSVPFGQRGAEGRQRRADAAFRALQQQRRLATDTIAQELANLMLAHRTAQDIAALTRLESQQAQTLLEAEIARFRSGASDFFRVNLREQTAANARIRLAEAEEAVARTAVAWRAATFDFPATGNDPEPSR